MQQTICDVCGNIVIKESKVGLKITTSNGIAGGPFYEICDHCSSRIYKLITEIKERPRACCKECGHVA